MIDATPVRIIACAVLAYSLAFCADAQTSEPSPITPDVAADWQNVLDQGDLLKLMDTYDVVDQISDEEGVIQADLCTQHESALDQALITNRVGLAVWYAGYQCAELLNDEAEAERRLAQFEALVRYGFEQSPEDTGRPIRVLAEADILAFVEASGQELLYFEYDPLQNKRYLLVVVGLWDEETQSERALSFDYLDTFVKFARAEPSSQYPIFRKILSQSILEQFSENPDSAGASAHQLLGAFRKREFSERLDGIEALAQQGSVTAAIAMLAACESSESEQCGARSIDALLPFAESRIASAMVALAVAYARGVVVPRDPDAARSLLDAADARLGGIKGRLAYTGFSMSLPGSDRTWPIVEKDLERAAKAGDPVAVALLSSIQRIERKGKPLRKRMRQQLRAAAEGGHPLAQYVHGSELIDTGASEEGFAWVEKAAESGLALAQSRLAFGLLQGKGITRDPERMRHWLAEAGLSGDVAAMYEMARYYSAQENTLQNRLHLQGWLQSAATAGHMSASMDLAKLFETEQEGLLGDASNAASLYRHLLMLPKFLDKPEAAEARRRLGEILRDGRGVEADREEAERLLKLDAERGISASQLSLATLYLKSSNQKDHKLGIDWLNKAVDAEDPDAIEYQAFALWFGYRLPTDRKKAAGLFQKLIDAEDAKARNNFAWLLCTSGIDADRDGKRGLALMAKLDQETLEWVALDTIAACHAADSAFGEAIAAQTRVIEAAKESGVSAEVLAELNERLLTYQNNQPAIRLTSEVFAEDLPAASAAE